ncbi:MAG: LTA synthase family protein [Blautia sp.]|nr:LTA synthase family protein [Blautia sp.]
MEQGYLQDNLEPVEESGGRAKETKSVWPIVSVLLFFLFAAAAFYLMEAYEHNPFLEVRPKAQLFNLLLFELIAWTLYLLTNRMRLACRLLVAFSMLFGLVNYYVMRFRSTPFVPWDIFSAGTAASVAGNYDFTPELRMVLVSLAFVLLFVLAHFMKEAPRIRPLFRFPAAAAGVVFLCVFTHTLQDEQFQIRNYLYPYLFTPGYMTEVNGMAVTFAMNLQYLEVEQPKGYDRDEAEAILEEYGQEPQKGEYPNIIVIMDEAFSEPAVLGELRTNQDYMPFYHELLKGADNTVTGYAEVSVCGGNTANSEFEFLTGNTMAFLPEGSIPYQQYIKRKTPSLAEHLAGLGYQTYAQHPYYASGWEREKVYPLLGFADTDFIDDYTDKEYVRKYISDACDFAHVIHTYESKEPGSPAFIFNVTMQNHGGYTDEYADFASDVQMEGGSAALNQYLSLLRRTDESLRELITYFSGVEEPTVVVFFGDHQPGDSVVRPVWEENGVGSALSAEQQRLRYQVPYLIWANFEIPEEQGLDMSLNYLGYEVLERAGVPVSAYQNFLGEMRRVCPVLSAAGRTEAAEGEELEDWLLRYQKVQYYRLFDNRE